MTVQARDIVVTGRVQGVGYRPFVYLTAHELGITGSVLNGSGKVFIHAEGSADQLDRLEAALIATAPPLARPQLASSDVVAAIGAASFEILASDAASEPEIHVPPDLFTCDACLAELTGPRERRYGYPFINCTQCGPRYTIISAMPYDRPNTSMAGFPLCADCRSEYLSPLDRRFHAQPLACPVCGPQLTFEPVFPLGEAAGAASAAITEPVPLENALRASPLQRTIAALEAGQIVAVKGVGGFHLVCNAANDEAVLRLRKRKRRPHKPLAVMFPLLGDDGLGSVREQLLVDELTAAAITDPARPIVLARKKASFGLSGSLAPGLSELGAFLPYSPLHHELLAAFGRPLVATSGNSSGEPVITDNEEAQARLSGIVDAFLHHDRPIVRPADDPVVRPMAGAVRTLRLGRGLAPLEHELPARLPQPLLATGGHMKVTVALAWGQRVVISPHVGDLDSPRSFEIFNSIINDLKNLYNVKYHSIVCDMHPGYASSRWASQQGLPLLRVQHHAAHASALAGEHPDVMDWLVFTWDGVGYGSDGTLWGGEALHGRPGAWQRQASFRPFRLLGGDKAGREPWRSAAALSWERLEDAAQQGTASDAMKARVGAALAALSIGPEGADESRRKPHLALAHQAWQRRLNTFETSAVGRLFDAAAALVLGRATASFEGQGPMELEHVARDGCDFVSLPLAADCAGVLRSDWAPLVNVLADEGLGVEQRAGIFHESMAQALLDQALALRQRSRFEAVGLSGGVFQNRRLVERVVAKLAAEGLEVRLHREVPANDGGLCFGQIIEATAKTNDNG
jgi:hydrogenase maturation protein HypF